MAGKKRIPISYASVSENEPVAILGLKSTPPKSSSSLKLTYRDPKGDQKKNVIQDLDGNDLDSFSKLTVTNNTQEPKSELKVDYADANGSTIHLYLTEALSSSIPKPSRFLVSANKRKQKITSITTHPEEGIITLNLKKTISPEKDILISYRDLNGDQKSNVIQDLDGNDLASFRRLAPTTDSDPPSLKEAYLDGKELVLEFDEILQSGRLSKSIFKVMAGKKRIPVSYASIPENDAVAILGLKSTLPASTSSLKLTYRDLKGDQNSKIIQDLDGNDLDSLQKVQVDIL